jgi:hypothetical protein
MENNDCHEAGIIVMRALVDAFPRALSYGEVRDALPEGLRGSYRHALAAALESGLVEASPSGFASTDGRAGIAADVIDMVTFVTDVLITDPSALSEARAHVGALGALFA